MQLNLTRAVMLCSKTSNNQARQAQNVRHGMSHKGSASENPSNQNSAQQRDQKVFKTTQPQVLHPCCDGNNCNKQVVKASASLFILARQLRRKGIRTTTRRFFRHTTRVILFEAEEQKGSPTPRITNSDCPPLSPHRLTAST